jgi:ribosomal protein S18 acetylase RimI-like enzyme
MCLDQERRQRDRGSIGGSADVEIGPVAWRELPTVARLQRRAFRPALAYRWPTLVMLLLLPAARFLVARCRGRVVGCAIGDRDGGRARVVNLAVDPTVQGRGIGRALLAALEDALPGGDILLMVEVDNHPARALYARGGYVDDGAAADYYGPGRPGLWMRKRRGPPTDDSPRLRV